MRGQSFWNEYLTMPPPHRDRKKSLKNPRNVPVDACPRDEDLAQSQVGTGSSFVAFLMRRAPFVWRHVRSLTKNSARTVYNDSNRFSRCVMILFLLFLTIGSDLFA